MYGLIDGYKYIKKEKEKSKLRLYNAWTINLEEIKNKNILEIHYITEKAEYIINSEAAHQLGFFRNFQGELKLVVPLKYWDIKER